MASLFFDGDKKVIYEVPDASSYTVDGDGYRIYTPDDIPSATLNNVITTYDIWSRWVDFHAVNKWALLALDISGGAYRYTDQSGDVYALIDIRLLHDWLLVPADYPHNWLVIGNLYPNEATGFDFDSTRLTAFGVSPRIQFADRGEKSVIAGGGTFTADDRALLTSAEHNARYNGTVYFDPVLLTGGDGTRNDPFGDEDDAIDFAENNNIDEIKLFNDWTPNRQIKNFQVSGVGAKQPTIDFNSQNVDGTRFYQVNLEGDYSGRITAQECMLLGFFALNGSFEKCGIDADLFGVDGAKFLLKNCSSLRAGFGVRVTLDMLAIGTCEGIVHGYEGGLTVSNCNQPTDALSVGMLPASVTLDDTNIDGDVAIRGLGNLIDESSLGDKLTDEHVGVDAVTLAVWLKLLGTESFP